MPNSTKMPATVPPAETKTAAEGKPSDSFGLPGTEVLAVGGMPQLAPPDEAATTAAEEGVTAWLTNRRIVGLWTNSSSNNSWINIQGLGWRRLFTGSDTQVVSMTMLATHARVANRTVNVRLESDNLIHEIYVW